MQQPQVDIACLELRDALVEVMRHAGGGPVVEVAPRGVGGELGGGVDLRAEALPPAVELVGLLLGLLLRRGQIGDLCLKGRALGHRIGAEDP